MTMPKIISLDILEEIKKAFNYNPINGEIVYKKTINCRSKIGMVAGKNRLGYRRINFKGETYLYHRIAWFLYYDFMPKNFIDHINGNGLDNRIVNLRTVTKTGNNQNTRFARIDNKSGVLGVKKTREGRYQSQIRVTGKRIYLGTFKTAKEAHDVYLKYKRKLHKTCTI